MEEKNIIDADHKLEGKCPFCDKPLSSSDDTTSLGAKGVQGVLRAAKERGDELHIYIGMVVHTECRRKYTDIRRVRKRKSDQPKSLRSSGSLFNFNEHCLFCGKSIDDTKRQKCYREFYTVRTKEFQNEIYQKCKERKDTWGNTVMSRIEFSQDLHASDTIYHQYCSVRFRSGKDLVDSNETPSKKRGRCKSATHEFAFMKIVEYLEAHDEEQLTVSALIGKMREFLNEDGEPYSFTYMKLKLQEYFGEDILFAEVNGKPNVVTLKVNASKILQQFYSLPKCEDTEEEKRKVIETAAKLIKIDIKDVPSSKNTYPTSADMASTDACMDHLPESLQLLLRHMFAGKDTKGKQAAIGQAIVQATRPKSLLMPLQLGLAIQFHHHFGSRFLVDTLHNLGFCVSYQEVKRYERSAAVTNSTAIPGFSPGHFIQFVADNVDHNICTLDGHGTFHGMGIIAAVTPGTRMERQIPRIYATQDDVQAVGKIKVHFYSSRDTLQFAYGPLKQVLCTDVTNSIDVLWKTTWLLKQTKTSWNGTMQMIHQNEAHTGKSSVVFMPMIDLKPTDESCIYSTLYFVSDQAKLYGVTPILTFDQPLYWKAFKIVETEPSHSQLKGIVLRLGGLHLQMSFLGCIGQIMTDSGLQELLETCFAEGAVTHMLTGKAISRAIRGHGLVFNINLSSLQEEVEDNSTRNASADGDLVTAEKLFNELLSGEMDLQTVCLHPGLTKIKQRLEDHKSKLQQQRTPKLWLQYMEMISILRLFIKAERTGNWTLHLQSVRDMLPFFTSAGHSLYAKSAYVYLMKMQDLPTSHPDVHSLFCRGYHVIRRSDRFWAGLSTDLVIEQVLMRSLKSVGGLTRGRGMTEVQRSLWLLSRPACSDINDAMQQTSGTIYSSSEQHKESTHSRQLRDEKDTLIMLDYLQDRNPFSIGNGLKSISSGVVSDVSNTDDAKQVGTKILDKMVGTPVESFTFKKKDQVIRMNDKAQLKIEGEAVHMDPQLLFQRLITAARSSESSDLANVFSHELCTYPPSLFQSQHLMREADKHVLAQTLMTKVKQLDSSVGPAPGVKYIIDGGMLLHLMPWPSGDTYGSICSMYVDFVQSRYPRATVVFDGYEDGPTTKDNTHLRRTGGVVGTKVQFTETMTLRCKKKSFLSNQSNKQRFIDLLGMKFQGAGIATLHAKADADYMIVQTAVQSADEEPTTLVGDDTDLLVLLCFYTKMTSNSIFLENSQKKGSKKRIWNIHDVKATLGQDICENLLFLHAILGCDTTSKMFGFGKGLAIKLFEKSEKFQHSATVFNNDNQGNKEDIVTAGETALMCLFKGGDCKGLDHLRVVRFTEKVASSSTVVDPKVLPPTSAAAKYHSLRVYFQIQEWKGNPHHLNPTDWGWESENNSLRPKTTDKAAAPPHLLTVIRCSCKSGCKSASCTCRKYGFECSTACLTCKGVSCHNALQPDLEC